MAKKTSRRNNRTPHELTSNKATLVVYLRYGSLNATDKTKIWHSYQQISKLLPLTVNQVKGVLAEDVDSENFRRS